MSDRLTIEQRHNNMADCAYTQGVTLGGGASAPSGRVGVERLLYRR